MDPDFNNRMQRLLVAAATVALLLAAIPAGQAHAAPDPPDYMTRLLHDYNDDWGGDQAGSRDGHDIMALDLQEAYNATMGQNVLVFRLTMNFGYTGSQRPELREVFTFQAKGSQVSKEFKTTDNQKFTGTFDAVNGPYHALTADGSRDGTRFYLEGIMKYSTLSVNVGDKISNFFVQGYAGPDKRDHMVGGFTFGGQTVDQPPPEEQSQPASYKRQDVALAGPTQYATLKADPVEAAAETGDNTTITLTVKNKLSRPQTITLDATKPQGVSIAFHGDAYRKDRLTFAVASRQEATVHAYLSAAGPVSGTVEVLLSTDLGGRVTHGIAYTVTSSGAAGSGGTSAAGQSGPDAGGGQSPGPGMLLAVAAAAVGALLRPRRGRA